MVDFPRSKDKIKGYVMKTVADNGNSDLPNGPGEIHVRPTPPESWEGGDWGGEMSKTKMGRY
jgi:hypothetical protein